MAFNPFAGSAGRIQVVAVTPALSLPVPTLTGLTPLTAAGITDWSVKFDVDDGGGFTHYESPQQGSTGVLMTEQLQGGVGKWSCELAGMYDGDTTKTDDRFANGQFVVCNLLYNRDAAVGRPQAKGKVKNYQEKHDHKANHVTFTCTIEGHGALPAVGVVS